MFSTNEEYNNSNNINNIRETDSKNNIQHNVNIGNHNHHLPQSESPIMIQIPCYFGDNTVNPLEIYSRDQIIQQNNNQSLYSQPSEFGQNNNNMLYHSETKEESHGQHVTHDNNNDWQHTNNEIYQQNILSNMYNSVLESPYPTPQNIVSMESLPTPSYGSLISFDPAQNFNYSFNQQQRRQNYVADPYESDYHQRTHLSHPGRIPSSPQKPPVYTKWTEEEDELLRAAISIYGPHKWSLIAAHVPNRTPMQCSTRWLGALNPTIHKGRWTPEEDAALKDAVSEFVDLIDSDGHPQPIPWNKIASRIPHRTGIQCQARWSEALDPSVRKGKWSPDEDEILKEGVRRYGRCWIRIAELIEGRTQRQCRTRWVQIKNKQAKLEKDAMMAKTANNSSTDDDNDDGLVILTPPNTTPSTPAQTVMRPTPNIPLNHIPPQAPRRQLSGIPSIMSHSPILSPSPTDALTSPESCVTTPESTSSSPVFNNLLKTHNDNNMISYPHDHHYPLY
ncbi:17065_t:CDS:2 [Dentiscutata erythropus]|uniref:17065_t:CDS:1 n=1 Tax=Dentiscutata erythropus TaxID=1348616 RepID=A0A9N9BB81_9GLOM|nr:17065_t:CDS:2 [Dentiscutata erythropus]